MPGHTGLQEMNTTTSNDRGREKWSLTTHQKIQGDIEALGLRSQSLDLNRKEVLP